MKEELENYFDRLWPICRSITGNGVRSSLSILNEIIPLQIHEVPSGKEVFDWTVPNEWNIEDAYIITPEGKKIADFQVNNLHLVSYSIPVDIELSFEELAQHIHTIPDMPDAIPYVTSYYKERWGFCLSQNEFERLPREGKYRAVVKSTLEPGSLTYGECVLPGTSKKEIFFSTYVCHPSMANNELSGPLVQAFLYKKIASLPHRKYTYRFVFIPETIGAIAFLNKSGFDLKENMDAGYVLTCVGDAGNFHYKRSRRGNSLADRAAEHFLKFNNTPYEVRNFKVNGSDERQYCSPGFNLPVGSLMRTPYYEYPYYHTSLDNKSFMDFDNMAGTVEAYFQIIQMLELNETYVNQLMYCEPQLGKRGLYPSSLTHGTPRDFIERLLHVMNYSDGERDLIEIAELFGASILTFEEAVKACVENGLLAVKY
ncbi:MAG: DUF4910 domain-containing protein [Flavobacteriales bacterium]